MDVPLSYSGTPCGGHDGTFRSREKRPAPDENECTTQLRSLNYINLSLQTVTPAPFIETSFTLSIIIKIQIMETTIKKCGCGTATVQTTICSCGDDCPGSGCTCGCTCCA